MTALVVALLAAAAAGLIVLVVAQFQQHVRDDVGYTIGEFQADREAWSRSGALPSRVTRVYIGKQAREADGEAMAALGYRLEQERVVQWPRNARLWVGTWVRS